MLDRPGRKSLREVEVPADAKSVLLENVVAEKVDVVLHVPPWIFHRPIDLRDGQDAKVLFDPKAITVTGVVEYGGDGHPATVEFQTTRRGDTQRVATDAEGAYRAELFRAGYYLVNVRLADREGLAHLELLDRPLEILAWSQEREVDPAALRSVAVHLPFPWQEIVSIETLD